MGLKIGRCKGQQVYAGDEIIITVSRVFRDYVELDIKAPAHIPVHRAELREKIIRETGKNGHKVPGR